MRMRQVSLRLGGLANLIGGALVATAYVLHPHHATPEVVAGGFWLTVHVLFAVSLLFGVFGLVAVYQRHLGRSSAVGLLGFVLATMSLIWIFGLNYFETFINPVLAHEAAHFVEAYGAGTGIGHVAWLFPVSGACFLLGYGLLCIDLLRKGTFSMGPVGLLLVGTLVFGVGLSGLFPMLVVQIGSVLFGGGLAWLGVATLRTDEES